MSGLFSYLCYVELLTEKIKQKALEIGFHKIGIASADSLTHEREHFLNGLTQIITPR
ncbi:MAG: hypothetical protein HC846_02565 [Blastocatellia bacterium]|nr:hypothetical protein [Blastocatellia bacterium]